MTKSINKAIRHNVVTYGRTPTALVGWACSLHVETLWIPYTVYVLYLIKPHSVRRDVERCLCCYQLQTDPEAKRSNSCKKWEKWEVWSRKGDFQTCVEKTFRAPESRSSSDMIWGISTLLCGCVSDLRDVTLWSRIWFICSHGSTLTASYVFIFLSLWINGKPKTKVRALVAASVHFLCFAAGLCWRLCFCLWRHQGWVLLRAGCSRVKSCFRHVTVVLGCVSHWKPTQLVCFKALEANCPSVYCARGIQK